MLIAFDIKLRRPGCVITQAALGGDASRVGQLFKAESWLTQPTPDMKVYHLPEELVSRVVEEVNSKNYKEKS